VKMREDPPRKGSGMTRVEHTIEIARPLDEVFDFITDPVNDPVWLSSVLDVRAPEGPIAVGSESSRR
jgi:hypothetical protein